MAKLKNEIGNTYGKLTVISRGKNKGSSATWNCLCECGNIKENVLGSLLRLGKTSSCGCLKRKDYTGQKYGHLTAISFEYLKNNKSYWKFKCDCGNYITHRIDSVLCGDKKTCGQCESIRIINERGNRYGKLLVIDYAYTKNGSVFWKCNCDCGNTKIARGSSLRSGGVNSCGCIISKGESYIQSYLEKNNINFISQYKPSGLLNENGNQMRFDFAILNSENIVIGIIEFDGIQHFENSSSITTGWGHTLEINQIRDKIKTNYCIKNDIPLCRIKYNQFNNIDTILNNFILEVKK